MAVPTKLPAKPPSGPASPPEAWTPFDPLRREMEQLFDRFGLPSWPLARSVFQDDVFRGRSLAPAVDVAEKDKEFEITAELPGLDEKDVEVKLSNGTLTIRGEKKDEKEQREKGYHLSERRYGSFLRSFRVPEGIDPGKIEARFAKGVLTIRLPKTAAAPAETTIPIRAA
ncbi:Hsp20/alpha crystallin family protein [Ancylobacter mangrovi]|uniref:Hsp20/alpha crystallin family protein n=1 Tax=Ancylobacter mangrovi TaxID=2972472 RepID=UPI0021634E21|nr:Hsp20/alpha crystallin family protein [Ancylobacter mangrovi]MCS0502857.1 Hsp20/alpha crystallin family protein [Ancylobacter mangrovi]